MHDCVLVRVVQRLQHSVHHRECLGQWNRPLVQEVPQRTSAHELEHDVVRVADLFEVVDLHKVWMTGPGHDLCFLEKTQQGGRVSGWQKDELLDSDLSAEPRLLGQVNGTHAAASKLALDKVFADLPLPGC